jgi:hypothetical protein
MSLPVPCLVLCAVVALFPGCSTPPKQPILTAPDGKKLCAVHRTPLVRVKAWRVDPGIVCLLPAEEYFAAAKRFPNGSGLAYALKRGETHTVAAHLTYCPACDAAIEGQLR